MTLKLSRKNFLKKSLLGLGLVSSNKISWAALAAKGELATLFDLSKCIGCEACVFACQESNESKFPNPKKPFPKMYPARVKVADWSNKREVSNRLTPYNWLTVQTIPVKINGEETELNIPRRCMHCQEPPCVSLCPWGAAQKDERGIARIENDLCLGGAKCKSVCPWKIPERQTGVGLYLDILPSLGGNGVMYKCDRCYDKLDKGELPACVEACPEQVQEIGPRKEIIKKAHALAKKINGYIYGENENGGTNTIYVSPVPFEELEKNRPKGPGKPHLNKVKNSLEATDLLAKIMLLAPVAGVAAAFGRVYNSLKKGVSSKEKNNEK